MGFAGRIFELVEILVIILNKFLLIEWLGLRRHIGTIELTDSFNSIQTIPGAGFGVNSVERTKIRSREKRLPSWACCRELC